MHARWRERASLALAAVPPLFILALVLTHAVDIVFWDQWNVAELLVRWKDGALSFEDLFAQHNESRMVFPRLAWLALGLATGWDVRAEMLLTFALACVVGWSLWRLARATLVAEPWKAALAAALLNAIVFTTAQHENWLWGFQIVIFAPVAALTSAYALAYSRAGTGAVLAASAVLALVATYSMANGMVTWLLIPPVLAAARWDDVRRHPWRSAVPWAALAAVAIGAFFHGYERPAHHPPLDVALRNPGDAARYLLAFLGSSLNQRHLSLAWAIGIGAALLAAYALLVAWVAARARTPGVVRRAAPWVALGLYALAAAASTTLGRLGFGVQQALDSRYVGFSVYLTVAVAGLTILWVGAPAPAGASWPRAYARARRWLASALLVAFAVLYVRASRIGIQAIEYLREVRRTGVACQQFAAVLDDPWIVARFSWMPVPVIRERLRRLDALGLLGSGLLADAAIEPLAAAEPGRGHLDGVERQPDGTWRAVGWAALPGRHRRLLADVILFTHVRGDGRERVFSMTDSRVERGDVIAHLRSRRFDRAGFAAVLTNVPEGGGVVRAWAYDAVERRAYRLAGEARLPAAAR